MALGVRGVECESLRGVLLGVDPLLQLEEALGAVGEHLYLLCPLCAPRPPRAKSDEGGRVLSAAAAKAPAVKCVLHRSFSRESNSRFSGFMYLLVAVYP
jgi:hypothetical protein